MTLIEELCNGDMHAQDTLPTLRECVTLEFVELLTRLDAAAENIHA
jgi:hypothetical protein